MLFIVNNLSCRLDHLNIEIHKIFIFNTLIFAEFSTVLNVALIIDFVFDRMKMYRCFKNQNFSEDLNRRKMNATASPTSLKEQLFIKYIFNAMVNYM